MTKKKLLKKNITSKTYNIEGVYLDFEFNQKDKLLIPKMHKDPYKHKFIAGSSQCSTKLLSILLTKLLTHIKQGL